MTPELYQRAKALFAEGLEVPAEERIAWLAERCPDPELRDAVEQLLAELDNPHAFVEGAMERGIVDLLEPGDMGTGGGGQNVPERIGQYRIVREIGRGGMGIVFEAEQENPRRRVALKVVRQGLDTASLVRRFHQEAHVLGQLQHPGIAQIYEAGSDSVGDSRMPFFAMELIEGAGIGEAAEFLTVSERLELAARVCDAVQHAHQKGVIHRDLKPANIMVVQRKSVTGSRASTGTTIDGIGQPKIMDFGIARLLDADLQAITLETHAGQIVGTLGYMSPEQVVGDRDRIDTRSDVYALGVVLYELVTGRKPHELSGRSVAESVRIIREEEPARVGVYDRSLRGDVETIIAKAMDKDPERRYASAAGLAADIRRHLADEPIEARPASSLYQLGKFARRNVGLVAGLAMTLIALAAGLIGTISYLLEAHSQRDAAVAARVEAERVTDFQAQILSGQSAHDFGMELLGELRSEYRRALEESGADEAEIETKCATFGEAIDQISGVNIGRTVLSNSRAGRALALLEEGFTDVPETEARLRFGVGAIYLHLGMHAEAAQQFEEALAIRRERLGLDHADTLKAMQQAAIAYRHMGQVEKSEPLFRDALARQQRVLGEDAPDTLLTMAALSQLLIDKIELDEAEALLTTAYEASKRTVGPDAPFTLDRLNELGFAHMSQGRLEKAIAVFRELLEARQRNAGPDDPSVIAVRNNLMSTLFKMNRLQEAEPIAREVVASSERMHGRDHPLTLMAHNNLGIVLLRLGRLEEAESLFRAVYTAGRQHLDPENEVRMKATSNLIDTLLAEHRPDDAEAYCDELLEVRRGMREPRPGLVAQTLEQLGWAHFDRGQFSEARDAWRECVTLRAQLADGHWLTNRARSEVGMSLTALNDFEEAEVLLTESYTALMAQHEEIPPGDGATCLEDARIRLVGLYERWGKPGIASQYRTGATVTPSH